MSVFFLPPDDMSVLLQEAKPNILPSTKLICTIGPVSSDVETLKAMIGAGMTMARFDFSHVDEAAHQAALKNVRTAMEETHTLVATVMDTRGPEILVVNRPPEPLVLSAGQALTLTADTSRSASSSCLPISYPLLSECGLQPGAHIFVGQYLFTGSETTSAYLTVQAVEGRDVVCVVANSCVLEGVQLTVHIGCMSNAAPILADSDRAALAGFGARNSVDFVALSFTRCAQDVRDARTFLDKVGLPRTKIIAKIENREGLVAYHEICSVADGIILSRGSMGNCLDPEKMFLAQKMLLQHCNLAGVPIFVTRVVDTMTEAPRPTRAEATDVANLVLDGADGIVLGSETYRGKFPVAAVETVAAIAKQAEATFDSSAYYNAAMDAIGAHTLAPNMGQTEALATAAVRAATKLRAALIVVFTVTGRTARLIAKYRPAQPILTVVAVTPPGAAPAAAVAAAAEAQAGAQVVLPHLTTNGLHWSFSGDSVARQVLQFRGVQPVCADASLGKPDGAVLKQALAYARARGLITEGDRVVVSQCPRANRCSDVFQESGVVKIVTVDSGEPRKLPGIHISPSQIIGSNEDLVRLSLHEREEDTLSDDL